MADNKPKIKNLNDGVIICAGCGSQISISDYEPLGIADCPDCSAPNFIPFRLKDYWLFKPLGGGGMGSVYQAVCESAKGDFAVKILPRKLKTDPNLIKNLMREGEIGKITGSHPNIVELVDYGVEDDEHFLITRFAEGTRLDILISSAGQLSERHAIDILKQILAAETHIKDCGFLFRDMKPENIMIMKSDKTVVKLYDFGLCQSLEEAANPDPNDSLEGSPFYLPPERIVAAPEGEYSEIYSMGMVFFHMLTGTTYFSQSDIKELMTKHVASLRMASVSTRLKHCSPSVISVVDKMIKRNPNDRYPDFNSLKEALDALDGETSGFPLQQETQRVDMHNTGEGFERVAPNAKRGKWVNIAALTLAVFIAGGFALWMYLNSQKEKKLLNELAKREAVKLGISADVAPPDKTEMQLYDMIEKRKKELLAKQKAKLPKFDEKAVLADIRAKLHLTGAGKKAKTLPLAEVKKLVDKKVNAEIQRRIADSIKPFPEKLVSKMIAAKLKLKLPLSPPDIPFKQLRKKVDEEVMEKVKRKFPPRPLIREISNIMKKYRAYRVGDRVTIPTKDGTSVTGRYQGLNGRYVTIDGADYPITDLPPSVRLKFNSFLVGKKKKREVAKARRLFNEKREKYKKPLYEKRLAEQAQKHGYVHYKKSWVPAKKLFDAMMAKAREEYETKQTKNKIALIQKAKKSFDYSKLYLSYGYAKQGKKYVPVASFISAELKKRKSAYDATTKRKLSEYDKKAMKQARREIYTAHGYVFAEGLWQPAYDLLKRKVHNAYAKMNKNE